MRWTRQAEFGCDVGGALAMLLVCSGAVAQTLTLDPALQPDPASASSAVIASVASVDALRQHQGSDAAGFEFALGPATSADLPHPVSASRGPRPLWTAIQTVRLGWRYRMPDQAALVALRPDLRSVGRGDTTFTKVGVEWKPAQSQIDFLRGGLGFMLDRADHMSIRLRRGSFGVYLNRRF